MRLGRRLTEVERRHLREMRALGRKHGGEMADVEERHRGEVEDLVKKQEEELGESRSGPADGPEEQGGPKEGLWPGS